MISKFEFALATVLVAGCGGSQAAAPKSNVALLSVTKIPKSSRVESDDGQKPKFPLSGETGHRTDDDKVDSYVRVQVNEDGSWSAFMHTTPTGHVFGGCAMYTVALYDANSNLLFARDLANFCTGTRDGLGGPSDREDNVAGGPGEFPTDALQRTRKWSVISRAGEGHTISIGDAVEAAKVVAQFVALIASSG